jgi:hypothetical protein
VDVYVKAGFRIVNDDAATDGVLRIGRELIPFPNPSANVLIDTLALLRVSIKIMYLS